jgi:hypothetical protein
VKIHQHFVDFHKILLKFTKICMDFQLTNFFGEFYMIFSLSVEMVSQMLLLLQSFRCQPLPVLTDDVKSVAENETTDQNSKIVNI